MVTATQQGREAREARAAEILRRVHDLAQKMTVPTTGTRSSTTTHQASAQTSKQNEYWRQVQATRRPRPATQSLDCPVCGGDGVISLDVPLDDPRFGKAFPCPAPGCPARRDREAKAAARRFKSSGLSGEQAVFRLSDPFFRAKRFRTALGGVERLLAARRFSASEDGRERHEYAGLYLHGPYGVGKSALAAATVTAFLEIGIAAHFEEVKRLLDWLRHGIGSEDNEGFDARLNALRTVPVLVLDDLGAHQSTPWAIAQVEDVVDWRYVNRNTGLVTIVTSNRTMQEVAEDLAEINDGAGWRILSRMRGMLFPVEIVGPDARVAAAR